jgi:hypothetical protein
MTNWAAAKSDRAKGKLTQTPAPAATAIPCSNLVDQDYSDGSCTGDSVFIHSSPKHSRSNCLSNRETSLAMSHISHEPCFSSNTNQGLRAAEHTRPQAVQYRPYDCEPQGEMCKVMTKCPQHSPIMHRTRNVMWKPYNIASPRPYNLCQLGLGWEEQQYLAHFSTHVIDKLPFNFRGLFHLAKGSKIVMSAAIALGAANLANLKGRSIKSSSISSRPIWQPEVECKLQGLRYTEVVFSLATACFKDDMSALIVAHLLLLFVETELGTYGGLRQYMTSINRLLQSANDEFYRSNRYRCLAQAVSDACEVMQCLAGPWNLPVQLHSGDSRPNHALEDTLSSDPARIYKLGTQAMEAGQRAMLLYAMMRELDVPSPLRQKIIAHKSPLLLRDDFEKNSGRFSPVAIELAMERCLGDLDSLAAHMRTLTPPVDILETMSNGGLTYNLSPIGDYAPRKVQEVKEISFASYESAMNAADYAFTCIMCDKASVLKVIKPHYYYTQPLSGDAQPWIQVLLKIAQGVDIVEHSRRTSYRRSIGIMLLEVALRYDEPSILLFLSEYLGRVAAAVPDTGSIWSSTRRFQRLVGFLQQQLSLGRIFMAMAPSEGMFSEKTTVISDSGHHSIAASGIESDGTLFEVVFDL